MQITVHVMNAPYMRSLDGGKTFTRVSTPHGDNHALWVNPEKPGHHDQRQRWWRECQLRPGPDLEQPDESANGPSFIA